MLVPRPYSLCRGIAFCALAMCFVPRRSASCHGNALCAATMFFLPRRCAMCRGVVLRAAVSFFVPRQCSSCRGKAVACVASFFVSRQETTCCSVEWHSAPSFLCPSAKNDPLLRSAACLVVLRHCSLCRGQVRHDAVIFLCHVKKQCAEAFRTIILHSTARNDALLHSMALRIMSRHGVLCRGVVCCAMAMFCHHTTTRIWGKKIKLCGILARIREKTINLCGIGCHDGIAAVVLALVVVVFLQRLLLCCCEFFFGGGGNQPVWLWLCLPRWHGGVGFLCVFAAALHFPPRHSVALFLCLSTVLCATAFCFVLRCSFLVLCATALFL